MNKFRSFCNGDKTFKEDKLRHEKSNRLKDGKIPLPRGEYATIQVKRAIFEREGVKMSP